MAERVAAVLVRRRWWVLGLALVFVAVAAVVGAGVAGRLANGGYRDPDAESARAERLLAERFGESSPSLVLLVDTPSGVDSPDAVAAGRRLTERIAAVDGVRYARSYWTTGVPDMRSGDGRTALVTVGIAGDDDAVLDTSDRITSTLDDVRGPLRVTATGSGPLSRAIEERSDRDLTRAELVTFPIVAVVLLVVFGAAVAAGLPFVVGIVSIVGALAILRLLAETTDVSVFALNVTTALGFGLAVDYSLFLVTRCREELAGGAMMPAAIATMLRTAGRTVLFSALTVAVSLVGMLVFPMYFLRSVAYAGIAVVLFGAVTSLVVLPTVLAILGDRIGAGRVRLPWRRRPDPADAGHGPVASGLWHRLADRVMRRPIPYAVGVSALLILLAVPVTDLRFGEMDHRVLPPGDATRAATERMAQQFPAYGGANLTVVLSQARGDSAEVAAYARELSRLPQVRRVETNTLGVFAGGNQIAPPAPGSDPGDGAWLTVRTGLDPSGDAAEALLARVRQLRSPGPALVGGNAALLHDSLAVMGDRLPWAVLIVAGSTFVLLFLFTGGLLIPVKALLLNVLSLTASFGAMVYVFQEGHLGWLVGEFTATGSLDPSMPILMFCIAFGLSMDYEVFLLSRISEEYRRNGGGVAGNRAAIAHGLARTGRLITAAALIVALALAALATSQLTALKLLGVGLAIAVVVDATLVRGLLVPAFMRLAGRANWWAPGPLRRLHARLGLRD